MTPELVQRHKNSILRVFPEAAGAYSASSGCSKCAANRMLGALFSIIARLPKKGRDLESLKGVIPERILFNGLDNT